MQPGRPLFSQVTMLDTDERRFRQPGLRIAKGRLHAEARDRGDARQGFAPKAERVDAPQVVHAGDLAGGMAGDGQFEFAGRNAAPVVPHADQSLPAVFHIDFHQGGPGVETVLHQFLDHTGRTLHHLPGGDLIAQGRVQQTDRPRPAALFPPLSPFLPGESRNGRSRRRNIHFRIHGLQIASAAREGKNSPAPRHSLFQ